MAGRARKIIDLSPSLVEDLPGECPRCCFWESPLAGSPGECPAGYSKELWISKCLDEGFCPGKLVQSEGTTLGYIQLAPAALIPRLSSMPYPVTSDDAVYVTCIYVAPELRGRGLGKLLIQSVENTLARRKYRILETHGLPAKKPGPPGPLDFFQTCGFRVVTDHREAPLMRLDLKALVPWKESVQSLLERVPLPSLVRGPSARPERPCA